MRILVDAMGGDNAPDEIIKGCLEALNTSQDFEIELLGNKSEIERCLGSDNAATSRITITETYDEISNCNGHEKSKRSNCTGIYFSGQHGCSPGGVTARCR